MTAENKGFLVVGVSKEIIHPDPGGVDTKTPSQTSIVGVATDRYYADDIIGKDYMAILNRSGRTPISSPLIGPFAEGDSINWSIPGYTWYIIPLQLNSIVNFTL